MEQGKPSRHRAPFPSWRSAGVTYTARRRPSVSTRMWRLRHAHAFMRIEATDPGRFLNRFDADAASMMARLRWGFLPTRSRSASRSTVSSRNQVPGIAQTAKMVEHRLEGAGSWLEGSAKGSPCAAQRRSHRRWFAMGELVVSLAWAREGDSVADTPTPHQIDCWDNWYSSFQSII